MEKDYKYLREQLRLIEQQIISITRSAKWCNSQDNCELVKKLIFERKYLLDDMFVATPEEIECIKILNECLLNLTPKMYAQTETLYRNMASMTYDRDFDDDIEVVGTLKHSFNEERSVQPVSNDDYYGSDFCSIFSVIDTLLSQGYLGLEEIEFCSCNLPPRDYHQTMSSKELRVIDELNDGVTWYSKSMPAYDKLKGICICHAIHDLNDHKPYSIPDILRMNDFEVEVTVKHQHFVKLSPTKL